MNQDEQKGGYVCKLVFPLLVMIGMVTDGYSQVSPVSPVQVSREPRHHKVIDNAWVRVLDVHIPPHDTTLMHVHSTPSVFIVLSKTKTGSQALVEPGKPAFTAGNIWFEGFYDKPRIHRVWNEDTVEFHVMDIELPHKPSGRVSDNIALPYAQSLFDAKPVHVFKLTLGPRKGFNLHPLAAPIVVIGLSGPSADGVVNAQRFVRKGDCLFVPAGTALNIANKNAVSDQQFAVLYLK